MNTRDTNTEEMRKRILFGLVPKSFTRETFENVILPQISVASHREELRQIYYNYRLFGGQYDRNYLLDTETLEDILDTFVTYFSGVRYPEWTLTRSSWFSHRFSQVSLGGLHPLLQYESRGRKPQITKNYPNLRKAAAVVATDVDDTPMLPIPKPLPGILGLSDSDDHVDEYYLALQGIETDSLAFLRRADQNTDVPSYSGILSDVYEANADIPELPTPMIANEFVWSEKQVVYVKNDTYYLTIPSSLVQPLPVDAVLLSGSANRVPARPAFQLFFDAMGNLFYERILYQQSSQENALEAAILSSEVPTELSQAQLEQFSIRDLKSNKELEDLAADMYLFHRMPSNYSVMRISLPQRWRHSL